MTVALVLILLAAFASALAGDHALARNNPRAGFFFVAAVALVILAAAERIAIAIGGS
jgi:hypothetical protein